MNARCKVRIVCMAVQVSLNLFSIPCRFKDNALNVIFGSVSWSVDVVFDVAQPSY